MLCDSIREFGFTNPVLIDGDLGIVAGHGRVIAAKRVGIDEVPTVELSHLTDEQKRAYTIADNRLAEIGSDWDTELLSLELEDLHSAGFEINLTGFDLSAIEPPEFDPGSFDDQGKLDEFAKKIVICPECNFEFDSRDTIG